MSQKASCSAVRPWLRSGGGGGGDMRAGDMMADGGAGGRFGKRKCGRIGERGYDGKNGRQGGDGREVIDEAL